MNSQNTSSQRTWLKLALLIADSLACSGEDALVRARARWWISDCDGDRHVIFSRSRYGCSSMLKFFPESYEQSCLLCRTDNLPGASIGRAGPCATRPLLERPAH